jgi:hypothetical protein
MSEEGEEREKTITLIHNKYNIPVKIKENYDKALESIKKALYLTQNEMDKLSINFKDQDGDDNMLEESNFDDAFEAEVWSTSKNSEDDEDKPKDNKMSEEDKNRIIRETRENCIKFMNEKIREINKRWIDKIDRLKDKFKNELEKREELNKSTINNIIKKITNDATEEIKKKVENYNSNIEGILKSKIEESMVNLTKDKNNFIENQKLIKNTEKEIREKVNESQINFTEIMKYSQANINNDQ